MQVTKTTIEGLLILEPRVFADARGYFVESYNKSTFEKNQIFHDFVQDNQSKSGYGVIRGLHFQKPPHAQTKLVRVLQGAIFDVAVDIRKGSPTFGAWFGVELSDTNFKQLLVPKGFAHGFSVLSETAVVMYKCDDYYNPQAEGAILFNDATLAIDWHIESGKELVSEKDKKNQDFLSLLTPFEL